MTDKNKEIATAINKAKKEIQWCNTHYIKGGDRIFRKNMKQLHQSFIVERVNFTLKELKHPHRVNLKFKLGRGTWTGYIRSVLS